MPVTYQSTDRTHAARLAALASGVVNEIRNRKPLQRMKASLRTVRHTSRVTLSGAGFYLSERTTTVVLTVIAVPAAVAATVGTAGALPVGLVVTAAVAWGVEKAFTKLHHNRDVNEILEALREFELDPESGGPDLSLAALPGTLDMARKMLDKLVSDTEKLDKEIKRYREASEGSVRKMPRGELIQWVLEKGKEAAGSGGVSGDLCLLPVQTKSKVAAKQSGLSLLHLRLQRIRGYIRWVHQAVEGLRAGALLEVQKAREIEPEILQMISVQVHAVGNHLRCSNKLCFGPGPADMNDVELRPGDPALANAIQLVPGYAAKSLDTLTALRSELNKLVIAEQASHQLADDLIDTAAEEAEKPIDNLAGEIGSKIGKLGFQAAGEVAGSLLGEVAKDGLGALINHCKESYRVNRPLLARVRALQDAIREQGEVSLDKEIVKLAEKNDLDAILRALDKATAHYPRRIAERSEKLRKLHESLKGRASSPRFSGQSRFATCAEAATALRYLYKVYHNAEKQMIHLYFVSLALDMLSRKVFPVSASLAAAPKPLVTSDMLITAIAGLRKTTPQNRPDPGAFERALRQQRTSLRPIAPQEADPLEAMRAAWAPLKTADLSVAGKTFISRAVRPPQGQPVDGLMTDGEWKDMSSIWGFRTDLTKTLDKALASYRESYLRNRSPQADPRQLLQDQLQPLLLKLKQRRSDLRSTLETAVTHWLGVKSDNATSKRRPAVEQLQAWVAMEARALDQAIGVLTRVQDEATALGMRAGRPLEGRGVLIEAEDD